MEGKIDHIVDQSVIKDFIDLKAGVDSVVASVAELVSKGVELNRELGAGTGFKKALDQMKGLEDIEEKLTAQSKELSTEQAKLDALYEKQAQKIAALKTKTDDLSKSQTELGRTGDFVAQSEEQMAAATKIASDIVAKHSGNLKENIRRQIEIKAALADVKDLQKAAAKEYTSTADAAEVQTARLTELGEQEALLKAQLNDVNLFIRQQSRELTSSEGSMKEYTAVLDRLQNEYKSLSAVERQSENGKALLSAIQELDPAVKGFNESLGQFNRSVGNYAKINTNFSGSLQILEKRFDEVKKSIDDISKSGNNNADVLEALNKEYELLDKLVNSQVVGFASATAELKNNEKALQALGAAGLDNTEFYQKLLKETAELKDNVGDLKNEIKNLASDTSAIDGLVQGAQALVGVYGIAQGAAALFGNESEQLQKTFVKLQAAQTILTSLQGIQNALQKDSSLMLAVNTGLQKIANTQKYLATAAESQNIVVKYAAIAAQKALNLVIGLSNPIMLVILATVGLLSIAYAAFASSTEDAAKSLGQMNTELEVNKQFLDSELNAIKNRTKERVAALRAGFATEAEIRAEEFAGRKKQLERIQQLEDQSRGAYDAATDTVRRLNMLKKAGIEFDDEQKKQLEEAGKIRDQYEALSTERLNAQADYNAEILNNQRAATVESAAIQRAGLQLEIDLATERASNLKSAAADDKRSYDERIKSLQAYAQEQKKAIQLTKTQQLSDPELSSLGRTKAIADSNRAIRQLEQDSHKELESLRREFAEKQRVAQYQILKTEIEDRQSAADIIANNEKESYTNRIVALADSYIARKQLIGGAAAFELQNAKLIPEERIAIEKKMYSDLNALNIEFGNQQKEINKANGENFAKEIETQGAKRISDIEKRRAVESILLQDQLRNGVISVEKYEQVRAEIERKYSQERIQDEIDAAQARVFATKEGTKERYDAERELYLKSLELSDLLTEKQLANNQKLITGLEKGAKYFGDTLSVIGDGLNVNIEIQKNAIQEQIDAIEVRKNAEIEAVNASTTSEQEKANKIALINANAQAKREALEMRQRQLDQRKAQFEKARIIAEIILNTALAVVKELADKSIPGAIAAGVIGAAQLAAAVATPIPKYADGILSHPGGLAEVGDGFKSEMVVTPEGRLIQTPAVPTIMNIPRGSMVLPDARRVLESGIQPAIVQMQSNDNGYRVYANIVGSKIDKLTKAVLNKDAIKIVNGKKGWAIINSSDRGINLNDKLQF